MEKGKIPWNKGLKGVCKPNSGSFKKGNKGYWLGKKRPGMSKEKHFLWKGGLPKCLTCNKLLSRRDAVYCKSHYEKKKGSNHYAWKGEDVGYWALHDWVYKKRGKPGRCEHCGEVNKKICWANKSHEYKREMGDWLALCTPCHRKYDGFNKLSDKMIIDINKLYSSGEYTQKQLGEKYSVNRGTIAKYLK